MWVHLNATEHLLDLAERMLARGARPDLVNVVLQQGIRSFKQLLSLLQQGELPMEAPYTRGLGN